MTDDPLYPLHQLRPTCVAIAFPRTAATAERGNRHARFKRNRNPTISTDWARLNATRLWRCNAGRHIHWYAIEVLVVTYWVFNQKRHTMTYMFWRCAYWFYYLTHPTALDPEMDQNFHILIHGSNLSSDHYVWYTKLYRSCQCTWLCFIQ